MSIFIAVASSDGVWVDLHFGRAHQFQVFAWDGVAFTHRETRVLRPGCSGNGHDSERLGKAADTVSDCRAVVASQIGPAAADALLELGIHVLQFKKTIEEAFWEIEGSPWFMEKSKSFLNDGKNN